MKLQSIIDRIFPPKYQDLVTLDRVYNNNRSSDVLIFGDSVMERVARQDTDKRTLGQMISDGLKPWYTSTIISKTGYHPSVYYYFILALSRMKYRPKMIIYPVNIRCFSQQWDLNPVWKYAQEMLILSRYHERKIGRVLKRNPSWDEMYDFRKVDVACSTSRLKTVGDYIDTIAKKPLGSEGYRSRKRDIFTFHYMYTLTREHQKLLHVKATLQLAREIGVRMFVYVSPVNVCSGEEFMGSELRSRIDDNVSVINETIEPFTMSGDVGYFDWSVSFGKKSFFAEDLATEHLNQNGRHSLSNRICRSIDL